ncbi:MAG TPA: hypothetical protein VEX38_03980, partial [Fimbriimonadaceae bacterium]|nr:hypothetical protein [Fimbriimonadaceae bacterium]
TEKPMKTLLIAMLALSQGAAPQEETATYSNVDLNISFTHPKAWIVENEKTNSKITIPLEGSEQKATLEIYSIAFNADTEIWQATQKNIFQQMKAEVLDQWKEEILRVPLLLTKARMETNGVPMITVAGLVYSATPRKLSFRLVAPASDFEKADFQWRTAQQTIRTLDGTLPQVEDPTRKPTPEDLRPVGKLPPRKTTWKAPSAADQPAVKGEVATEVQVGGQSARLLVPAGWTVEKGESAITLKNAGISSPVSVSVYSTLDSGMPGRALFQASGRQLGQFAKVIKREEKGPMMSKSHSEIVYIFRSGSAEGGKSFYSAEAAGANGNLYWILTWTGSDAAAYARDRAALENLIQIMSIEAAS